MANVWAIFSDSTASLVIMKKIVLDETSDLVLKSVGIDNPQVRTSGEKAITGAYNVLRDLNRIKNGNHGFSYEFREIAPVIHSSASLAFALKLVQKIEKISFSIAATGIVLDSSQQSPVERIDNINEKIRAAGDVLMSGDVIFFPAKNRVEITLETENAVKNKGIILQPVSTVENAVKTVLALNQRRIQDPLNKDPLINEFSSTKSHRPLLISALFVCLLSFLWFFGKNIYITINNHLNVAQKTYSDIHYKPSSSEWEAKNPHPAITPIPRNTTESNKKTVFTPTPKQNRPLRLKLMLTGKNKKVVSAVNDAMAVKLQKLGMFINNKEYDGIIKGIVRLTGREDIPLQPYASSSGLPT